ncbi:quinone oxidoreductase family protein [Rathayibacter tritici]|uniref:Quinone oxidoreductase n=1 Tax=Rathayibacter tritici TaxID=33888 RepID=A0A160KP72_9MICO|nr:zinc-binding dehydrogenase [Rathayibacter tritici]AND15230.1 quinone oxidoreductase [Rathayibacter tritici]PPI47670.1 NADPH:quinone reductase [Rathayibacter tritici]
MKALTITHFGGPTSLEILDLPAPEAAAGQVVIAVDAAGLGYVDSLFSRGVVPLTLPWASGIEVAGRVITIGEGVTGFQTGDQVVALTIVGGGGLAEEVAVDARLVAPLPNGLDLITAASIPANTTAALLALRSAGDVAGRRVLVTSAAGGLGSQLGALARTLGATEVDGVVGSESKRSAAEALGYDHVWTTAQLGELREAGLYDVIADPVGGPVRADSLELLATGGVLLAVGNAANGPEVHAGIAALWMQSKTVSGLNLGALAATHPHKVGQALADALALLAAGRLKPPTIHQVTLDSAATAIAAIESGSTVGKYVLVHPQTR